MAKVSFYYFLPALAFLYFLSSRDCVIEKENPKKQKNIEQIVESEQPKTKEPEQKKLVVPDYINPALRDLYLKNRDAVMMALTVYGEGRGESKEYRMAVANVIKNRAVKYGKSIEEVVLAPKQFSCWNADDVNLNAIKNLNMSIFNECYKVAQRVLGEDNKDTTNNSTHYCNVESGGKFPYWAKNKKPALEIRCKNGTVAYFYNNVR